MKQVTDVGHNSFLFALAAKPCDTGSLSPMFDIISMAEASVDLGERTVTDDMGALQGARVQAFHKMRGNTIVGLHYICNIWLSEKDRG